MLKAGTSVLDCLAKECSFNHDGKCRTFGINIGVSEPLCETFTKDDAKGGQINTLTKVGACKIRNCTYNAALECTAGEIFIMFLDNRPLCASYQLKVGISS